MITLVAAIIHILFAFLTGILKLVMYLLRFFGLIIPAMYVFICFLVNLALDNAILSQPEYLTLFFIGLVLSFVGAIFLFFHNTVKSPIKFAALNKREKELDKWESDLKARETALKKHQPLPQSQNTHSPQAHDSSEPHINNQQPNPSQPPKLEDNQSVDPNLTMDSFPRAQASPAFARVDSPQDIKKREPLIFRVRQNPKYLLYDYGDTIELYHETPQGLVYIRTDKKEGSIQ